MTEISLQEAAVLARRTERQVRYAIRTGRLPARKVGGQWLLGDAAVLSWALEPDPGGPGRPPGPRPPQASASAPPPARAPARNVPPVPGTLPGTLPGAAGPVRPPAPPPTGGAGASSVQELGPFAAAVGLHREVHEAAGRGHRAAKALHDALLALSRAQYSLRTERRTQLAEARDQAARAVVELVLDPGGERGRALARAVEAAVLAPLAALLRESED
jgi:hypothetical protein